MFSYYDKIAIDRARVLVPYFAKADIKFCSVPVPLINGHKDGTFEFTDIQKKDYGQSQTHPSIVYIPDGFGGHKWWLATTPYPHSNGAFENPCIYYGDEENGEPPLTFTPISGTASGNYTITNNPIVKVPDTKTTNSDPDLFFDSQNNKLCLISRKNTYGYAYYYQESPDGQAWTPRLADAEYIINVNRGMPAELVSPAIILKDGKNEMYGLSSGGYLVPESIRTQKGINRGMLIYNGQFTPKGMHIVGKASLLGKMEVHPWHFDICYYNNKYYMIFSGTDYNTKRIGLLRMAISDDGLDFKVYSRPLLPLDYGYYRPSFYIDNDTLVIYGCTESGAPDNADAYPNGASDVPVDGRAIFRVMGNLPSIVNTLKADEIRS